jgi:hypothetical protein
MPQLLPFTPSTMYSHLRPQSDIPRIPVKVVKAEKSVIQNQEKGDPKAAY